MDGVRDRVVNLSHMCSSVCVSVTWLIITHDCITRLQPCHHSRSDTQRCLQQIGARGELCRCACVGFFFSPISHFTDNGRDPSVFPVNSFSRFQLLEFNDLLKEN